MLIVDKGIDRINLRTMRSAAVVEHYSCTDELMPHERAALDHVANEMRGGSVLDLGVGAGRTVKALLEVSPDYLGIDYSQEMISACEARFPGIRFEHADARRLPTSVTHRCHSRSSVATESAWWITRTGWPFCVRCIGC